MIMKSDVICLSETWLLSDDFEENLQMEGFVLQCNSVGRGKGLATYFRPDKFEHSVDVKKDNFQLTKMKSLSLDIIAVYRSQEGDIDELLECIQKLVDKERTTVICGDLNICFKAKRNDKLIRNLETNGFKQHIKTGTHIHGGVIDHVYLRQSNNTVSINCALYSPYYCAMDHDALLVTVQETTDSV